VRDLQPAFHLAFQRSPHNCWLRSATLCWGLGAALLASYCCLSSLPLAVLAQRNDFPRNPLELLEPDPLLPQLQVARPLTVEESRQLSQALDQLSAQALALFQAGKSDDAFELWNRELRLRRVLGPRQEVRSLGRIGAIAWQDNRAGQVRVINERLQAIQTRLEQPAANPEQIQNVLISRDPDPKALRQLLGVAYQQIRAQSQAVAIYEQQLANLPTGDRRAKAEVMAALAELHFAWFDYPKAEAVYLDLLPLVRAIGPVGLVDPLQEQQPAPDDKRARLTEVDVLKRLIYSYEQTRQYEKAIATLETLIELYQGRNLPEPIPALRLAVAVNYDKQGNAEQAIANYQKTYFLAQPLRQFSYSSDALNRLGELYQAQKRSDKALEIYRFLLDVEQQSYNLYGRMMTFDRIGKIHLERQERAQAIAAFQQALALARQLNFREDYFTQQINAAQNP